MTIKFKNHYSQIGRKEGFKIKYEAEDLTDQSQLSSASITEMAKRYGIDAIIAKAEQRNIEANSALADKLYGNDFTQMFKSKEELLNTKKKLINVFENIPARIRKEQFNDNPMEFINAYVSIDENKLSKLADIGLISQTQLEAVKNYNKQKLKEKQENQTRQAFIKVLEAQQGELYEKFKETGTININNSQNIQTNNPSIQTGIQQSD